MRPEKLNLKTYVKPVQIDHARLREHAIVAVIGARREDRISFGKAMSRYKVGYDRRYSERREAGESKRL